MPAPSSRRPLRHRAVRPPPVAFSRKNGSNVALTAAGKMIVMRRLEACRTRGEMARTKASAADGSANHHFEGLVRLVLLLSTVLVFGACAAPAPNASRSLDATGEFALPTEAPFAVPPGAGVGYRGVGISARLHGGTADPHIAWLVTSDGIRIEALWPAGYRARFSPNLEVLDPSGAIVSAKEGSSAGAALRAIRTSCSSSRPSPSSRQGRASDQQHRAGGSAGRRRQAIAGDDIGQPLRAREGQLVSVGA